MVFISPQNLSSPQIFSWLYGHVGKWPDEKDKVKRHTLVTTQLQYTYCPLSPEVKAIRQLNLVS